MRLIGVAYFLGLSALTILMMFELVVGIPVVPVDSPAERSRDRIPRSRSWASSGRTRPDLRPPGWQFPKISVFAALFVAGIVVYFEALFRAERLGGRRS